MRTLGTVFLTGAAAVVAWKILAALFMGFLGVVLKVALALVVLYIILQALNGKKNGKEGAAEV